MKLNCDMRKSHKTVYVDVFVDEPTGSGNYRATAHCITTYSIKFIVMR